MTDLEGNKVDNKSNLIVLSYKSASLKTYMKKLLAIIRFLFHKTYISHFYLNILKRTLLSMLSPVFLIQPGVTATDLALA